VHAETVDLVKGQETQLGECNQEVTSPPVWLATVEIAVRQTQASNHTTNLLEIVLVIFFWGGGGERMQADN